MLARLSFAALFILALVVAPHGVLSEEKEAAEDLEGVKCPISKNGVNPEAVAEHGKGHIYMCCEKCVAAFEKNPEKFTEEANYQLVVTGQVDQVACPFSGRDIKEGTEVKAGYAEEPIAFCCKNCTKMAEGLEKEKLMAKVFGKEAFEKAFAFPEKDEDE